MQQVLRKKGQTMIEEVPTPIAGDNEVLVQVRYSCISTGTELSGIRSSKTSLYKKALREPQNVIKTLEMIRKQGLSKTIAKVKRMLESDDHLGYSAAGIVLEVGCGIRDIRQGDRVACAGAGIANHAEFIAVPRNLLVKVPENLSLDFASTVTLGSIALQGIRRADPKLGEFVAVIGLGLLGQLTSQVLIANGCKVVGIDVEQRRVDIAASLGMDKGLNPAKHDIVGEVVKFSNGYGVDAAILTASTESSDVVNQAMEMCRKKGKVVIVGAVGLNLKREELYKKELDVLISTSYGPGRYDERYEFKGIQYPYAYVRWTENRNMQEYLQLLAEEKINIRPLVERVYSITEARKAYEELQTGETKPLIVLLEYNKESIPERKIVASTKKFSREKINAALIGAGNFAKGMHLPNLRKLSSLYNIYAICDKVGSSAKAIASQYDASYATTDFSEALEDKDVDMVIIATRHNLHARMAIEAARAGKAVFSEKPMALNIKELRELNRVLEETKIPFTVGFNRRFSPYAQRIKEIVKHRLNPMIINYQMNAGFIPREHWTHTEEGGGRNIGEACHIYDLFNFLTESEVDSVSAFSIDPKGERYARNDNFVAAIKYKDGSVCNLIYTALGTSEVPKEQMEIYVDGKITHLDDYRKLEIFGTKMKGMETKVQEKGHYVELFEFARNIKEGNGYTIPLWQLIQATEISFRVEENL